MRHLFHSFKNTTFDNTSNERAEPLECGVNALVLDVVFHDDASRIRTGHATANFTFVRRYTTMLLKQDTCKRSLKQKRKKAGWNTGFLEKLLFSNAV